LNLDFTKIAVSKESKIRKNRNAVAVLSGEETSKELNLLGKDIFQYFGLGCRNVSKIFVPKNYDFNQLFESILDYSHLVDNHKYSNNYTYNKTMYLMSDEKLLDNNFLLLKKDVGMSSPVSVLFYEFYENKKQLYERLRKDKEHLQCMVAEKEFSTKESDQHLAIPIVHFGQTQHPNLWDYADGVNTVKFLSDLRVGMESSYSGNGS
jgi:hypothetical protein